MGNQVKLTTAQPKAKALQGDNSQQDGSGYRFRIYVDRAGKFIPKDRKPQKTDDVSLTGHAFISLIGPDNKEKVHGFYAKAFVVGNENVPPQDQTDGLKHATKWVTGQVIDDSHRRWDDYKEYNVSKAQFDKISKFVEDYTKNPPQYCMAFNNCTTFARQAGAAGGVKTPSSLVPGLDVPSGVMTSMMIEHGLRKAVDKVKETTAKIRDYFGNGPAVHPPTGQQGIEATRKAPSHTLALAAAAKVASGAGAVRR
jgi:hypothetical protein